ncbi:MAG: prolyl oligopeptidase family serine peptidase, partial [bacterium]
GQNRFAKVYFHEAGTDQSRDALIYEDAEHPDWLPIAGVTEDGKYLVLHIYQGTDRRNRIYFMRVDRSRAGTVIKLLDDFDAGYQFIGNDDEIFYFQTDLDAPKGRVIVVDTRRPRRSDWRELIAEQEDVLSGTSIINDQFVTLTMHDAHHQIKVYDKDGSFVNEIPLPALGSIGGISGREKDTEMFFGFSSFSYPFTIYRYDFQKKESAVFRAPDVDFNPEDYETKQVFYESKDGTPVPMFITSKKGVRMDGSNPTILYGYGGFNISLTPQFDVSTLLWMEMGGVYAMPNLRGGGEYGIDWYQQGILAKKQNVFDDFIAAAEYLIKEGYTSKKKLSIAGASNGGLLVGACMTQRPDLFAAALPAVGVLDMLRYHEFTIGRYWAPDYGRSDNPDDFKFLYAYSPLHRLKEGVSYPATLITTADHDDRVVPAHSFKFAATLQNCQAGDAPVLIRIETRAGHGAGKPTSKRIEELTDRYAFLVKNLNIKYRL